MCGIIGYVGKRSAADVCFAGLRRLEYRGYDSAGIATIPNGSIDVVKTAGRIDTLVNNAAALIRLRLQDFDEELLQNSWLTVPCDDSLIFDLPFDQRWHAAARLLADLELFLPGDLLPKVDRMSMASSVEARPPFLDHELWEFCAGLPPECKLGPRGDKRLLRAALWRRHTNARSLAALMTIAGTASIPVSLQVFSDAAARLLIVAPMSGHFATLLRGTVARMVESCEVFITDWADAKMVPLEAGGFDLDDYIDYLIGFLEHIGPGAHMLAV